MFIPTRHVEVKSAAEGITLAEIRTAADYPTITYANGRYPNQMRHIRGDLVTTVDVKSNRIVTFYKNVVETEVRDDQTDKDAQRYKARRGQAARAARKGGK